VGLHIPSIATAAAAAAAAAAADCPMLSQCSSLTQFLIDVDENHEMSDRPRWYSDLIIVTAHSSSDQPTGRQTRSVFHHFTDRWGLCV